MVENNIVSFNLNANGTVSKLCLKTDPYEMNWVIEESYLDKVGFNNFDKLFGQFELVIDDSHFHSKNVSALINEVEQKVTVEFNFGKASVVCTYDIKESGQIFWTIQLKNESNASFTVNDFGIWASVAYVMFRDKDVLKNIHHSASVFPSISPNYTKFNAVRRDNAEKNLGLYQTKGQTLSIGTYCEYENLFFENASPSLDGLLYHKLILAANPEMKDNKRDWIYEYKTIQLEANEVMEWQYVLTFNESQEDFYVKGYELGHPMIKYSPLNIINKPIRLEIQSNGKKITNVYVRNGEKGSNQKEVTHLLQPYLDKTVLFLTASELGEHKISFIFDDGTEDFIVLNVMDDLETVIEERVQFICNQLLLDGDASVPYAITPISNQGESLGKLNLVLKKNLLGQLNVDEVYKVEQSAVYYVKEKWFIDGDFTRPRKLYGEFYRCMDFEYIGHLFYLLSQFDNETLRINDAKTYLIWAAHVFNLRVNPTLHSDERGKEEAQMLGVYFLYIQDLLKSLQNNGLNDLYETIFTLWQQITDRVNKESMFYKAAITEHYYDNAGFGPTAGALSESRFSEGAQKYGQLLLANIGYSNDFRAQNPDRWWEALAYMIHSLWGGVSAMAAYKVFEFLQEPAYLNASYRAMAAVLYCYDTNSTTTLRLGKGMAASTYAVAGPHINRPDLSRERFGQATFFKDGGIFSRLFKDNSQTPDWDMGEEIVAYLDGLGLRTYILKDENGIDVINGTFEKIDDKYEITSFAPYGKEYWLIDNNGMQILEDYTGQAFIQVEI